MTRCVFIDPFVFPQYDLYCVCYTMYFFATKSNDSFCRQIISHSASVSFLSQSQSSQCSHFPSSAATKHVPSGRVTTDHVKSALIQRHNIASTFVVRLSDVVPPLVLRWYYSFMGRIDCVLLIVSMCISLPRGILFAQKNNTYRDILQTTKSSPVIFSDAEKSVFLAVDIIIT